MTQTTSAESNPTYARWLEALHDSCRPPHIPEVLLACFFETRGSPSLEQLAVCTDGNTSLAAEWQVVLGTRLLDPTVYDALFSAQDALQDCRLQRAASTQMIEGTATQLTAINETIAHLLLTVTLRESLGEDDKAQAIAVEVEGFREQQAALDRRQRHEFPAMVTILTQAEAAAKQALAAAEDHIASAYAAHAAQLEAGLLATVMHRVDAINADLTTEGKRLDDVLTMLGRDLETGGAERVRSEALRGLRGKARVRLPPTTALLQESLRIIRGEQDKDLHPAWAGQAVNDLRPVVLDRGDVR